MTINIHCVLCMGLALTLFHLICSPILWCKCCRYPHFPEDDAKVLLGEIRCGTPTPETREAEASPAGGDRGAGMQGLPHPHSREPLEDGGRFWEVLREGTRAEGERQGAALPLLPRAGTEPHGV